ncbi:MAG: calcium-translocating P-type ATPase, PMCA-type [Bacteroidota bacterium]
MNPHKHYTGLTSKQVEESRAKHGANILTPVKKDPWWKLYLEKFEDPIIRILLIAALLSLGISIIYYLKSHEFKEFAETIGIFCAILLATGVGFWFEMDANKKFDVLNQVNDDTPYKVIREGNVCQVPKKDIAVGDIVIMSTGEEIPADGKLLEAISLQIDESCLTGESVPACKSIMPIDCTTKTAYPCHSILKGTIVLDGHGIFEVTKVGDATEYGVVAEKSTEITGDVTPLNQQLDKLAKWIGVIGFGFALITFVARFLKGLFFEDVTFELGQLGLLGGVLIAAAIALIKVWLPIIYDGFELVGKEKKMPKRVEEGSWFLWIGIAALSFVVIAGIGRIFGVNPFLQDSWIPLETASHILTYFMVAVTIIVVAVPEGLPMSVTLSLALSMRKMLKSNNLVRKMHACETMGAATVICTDKTGTLTQNLMTVYKHDFFSSDGNLLSGNNTSDLIKEGISVNSTAYLDYADSNKVKPLGNPTEAALLMWLHKNGVNYLELREEAKVVEQLTFSCERKYMATMVESPLLKKRVLYVKGAPEIVFEECENVLYENGPRPTSETKKEIDSLLLNYQKQAMRTIGFAYEIIDDGKDRFVDGNLANHNLTFLGVVAISDPLREEVPNAVQVCLDAGIDIKIVTGDTRGTAMEIGRQIGILNENDSEECVISGYDFYKLNDDEAQSRVQDLKIICRARPVDKQRMVQMLKIGGAVVAVTGDGTNDAPALNYANVGLSMGSGTSVAKEASDITLIDDSFASITKAVLWGRTIFRNIQRFVIFQMTINVAALLIDFIGALFWQKLPLTVTQLLWINLIMDTFAAGALASLPADQKVMKDKPRDRNSFIINKEMGRFIFGIGFLFVVILLGMFIYFTYTDIFGGGEPGLSTKELTFFFTFFVMLQFWNMFNAKAFFSGKSAFSGLSKSVGFLIVAIVIFFGQILIVEFGGKVFRTEPLTLFEWIIIVGSTSLVLWIGEIMRLFAKLSTKK